MPAPQVVEETSFDGFFPGQGSTVLCHAEHRKSVDESISKIMEESVEVVQTVFWSEFPRGFVNRVGVFEVSKISSQDQMLHDVPVPRLMEYLVDAPQMEV